MAEAFARMHGEGKVEAYSSGSRPSGVINPRAIQFMKERGYDLKSVIVNFIVYWLKEGAEDEVLIVLPEVWFERSDRAIEEK